MSNQTAELKTHLDIKYHSSKHPRVYILSKGLILNNRITAANSSRAVEIICASLKTQLSPLRLAHASSVQEIEYVSWQSDMSLFILRNDICLATNSVG